MLKMDYSSRKNMKDVKIINMIIISFLLIN